jgi:hypothetical protein
MSKIDEILNYWRANRGRGHTHTTIEGAKQTGAIVIIANKQQRALYEPLGIPKDKILTIHQLVSLRGRTDPLVVDHYALELMVEELKTGGK